MKNIVKKITRNKPKNKVKNLVDTIQNNPDKVKNVLNVVVDYAGTTIYLLALFKNGKTRR